MNIITADYIKAHSRIEDLRATEDSTLLELYGKAAEETVLNYLNRTLDSIEEEYDEIPGAIQLACLFLVDHFYERRSPASMQQMYTVPYSFDILVKPYMIL